MVDQVAEQLDFLEKLLIKDAEAAGEGPSTMRRSKFVSEMEKQSFVTAYGQKAYDNLKD
jgi:hypothetical protein